MVYTDNKSEGKPPKDKELSEPFQKFVKTTTDVATIMIESKIELNKEEYVAKFAPDMMEITMKWC